ncbi:MAG: class I SAM-dependent methyltransferase [Bacteroidetes bacterium]|nr:class I SAM-dependent methyltransferase [Bacteroidota bacterium]
MYAIDINPECKTLEDHIIEIFIGSQSDRDFLRELKKKIPRVDISIDDFGHTKVQQIITFEKLFDHVKENGVYLCEDLHTSYLLKFGGGFNRHGTFIEYSKKFIDHLNAYDSQQASLKVNKFTQSVDSIHYYDSILVIEKRKQEKLFHGKTGKISFQPPEPEKLGPVGKLKFYFIKYMNKVLRVFNIRSFIWR